MICPKCGSEAVITFKGQGIGLDWRCQECGSSAPLPIAATASFVEVVVLPMRLAAPRGASDAGPD